MGPYAEPGPLPPTDHCGYEVAMQIVLSSLDPGRHSPDYKQWDTIRRIRTVFSNQSRASRVANVDVASFVRHGWEELHPDNKGSLRFAVVRPIRTRLQSSDGPGLAT